MKNRAYRVTGKVERETGDLVLYGHAPPDLLRFSLLIGDCAHNARAALDYLAWELVIAGRGKPTHTTGFPICRRPPLDSWWANKVRGIAQGSEAVIKELQPYDTRNGPVDMNSLWQLHDLDVKDKHQSLRLASNVVAGSMHRQGVDLELLIGPFEDGAEIGRIRNFEEAKRRSPYGVMELIGAVNTSRLLVAESEMHMQPLVSFGIAFDEGPAAGLDASQTLNNILRYVSRNVVNRLWPESP